MPTHVQGQWIEICNGSVNCTLVYRLLYKERFLSRSGGAYPRPEGPVPPPLYMWRTTQHLGWTSTGASEQILDWVGRKKILRDKKQFFAQKVFPQGGPAFPQILGKY